MVVGAIGSRTDVVVIGSGPGGYVAALRAADAGREVTLIERDALGGTCLNVGCIPSKTLIETANLRHRANAASATGLVGSLQVSMPTVQQHLESVSAGLRQGVASLLSDAGVTLIQGTAHFARYDRLSIEHGEHVSHLEFEDAIVATGSRPLELPFFPFGGRILDSTSALALTELPQSIVLIGAGYIGVELGTAFAKLGATVTLVEAANSILPAVPAQLRRPVERTLRNLGVTVITGRHASEPVDDGVELDNGEYIPADATIVAVGRRPNSDLCSLDIVGAETDERGFVIVDEHLRAAPHIYAIGDLTAGPALAHRATADAEQAVHHLTRGWNVAPSVIPEVIFSDPEIMSVGASIDQDDQSGLSVHRFPHAANARAQTTGSSGGATFVVADSLGTVVGVHAVGPHVSELAGEATLAIEMAATLDDLSLTVHPHPTLSETIAEASLLARGVPLHIRS